MISNKKELYSIIKDNGFTKNGSAFFRVIGDNILQIIKYEKERVYKNKILSIGLHSLYTSMDENMFTSCGCIARYSLKDLYMKNINPEMSYEEVNKVFVEKGLPELDAIVTSEILYNKMCLCDENRHGAIVYNDSHKLSPCLKARMYDEALIIIDAIISQHGSALESNKLTFADQPSLYERMVIDSETYLLPLKKIKEKILLKDYELIDSYLENNLQVNKQYLRKHIGIELWKDVTIFKR